MTGVGSERPNFSIAARLTASGRVLVLAPVAFVAWMVSRYAVDVPFWDEWSIAEFLQKVDEGTLTAGALLSQHNEHRMLVPRVVQLAVASVAGWDTRILMWLSQGLLVATLYGCVVLWRRSLEHRMTWSSTISLALISVLLFSPAQHQNLFWGFQFCFYLPGACLLASTIVTSSPKTSLGQALTAAAILATMATFSIFPGLLTWPLAVVAVRLRFGKICRATLLAWGLWAIAYLAVVGVYFWGYEPPPHSPAVRAAFERPLTLLAGIAICIGNPFGAGSQPVLAAAAVGMLATGASGWLLLLLWRRRADDDLISRATPWIVMSGFGFLSAAAISAGRVGYGYAALLESRYGSLTLWVFIGLLMLAAILRDRSLPVRTTREWVVACTALSVLYAVSLPDDLARVHQAHRERRQAKAIYMFADVAISGSPMVPPWLDWTIIKERLLHVERAGWRRPRPAAPTWMDAAGAAASCDLGIVEVMMTVGPRLMAGGWALLPPGNRPADAVLVTSGTSRRIAALQPPLIGRGDIGERFQSDAARVSGWLVDTDAVPIDEELEFWALDVTGWRAYRLCQPQETAATPR